MIKRSILVKLIMIGMFMLGPITAVQASPVNLALTGTATQSSTYSWYYTNLGPHNAIDGITDGNIWNKSVTHTYERNQSWWQVDLGGMFELDQIVLWNRTDCCGDRLTNFNVSVIDPLDLNNPVWDNDFFTATGSYPALNFTINLPDNTWGQIVKVRLNGTGYLSLAEVQVFPVPEPGTMLLLGSGFIGLVGYGRKKFFKK